MPAISIFHSPGLPHLDSLVSSLSNFGQYSTRARPRRSPQRVSHSPTQPAWPQLQHFTSSTGTREHGPVGLGPSIQVGPDVAFLALPSVVSFPGSSTGKESSCNVGDLGSIPGLGRSPGEGKGCPLQYSGLENSMDCIVRGVAKSRTRLSDFHSLTHSPVSRTQSFNRSFGASHY